MKFARLVWANLLRNKRRTVLTLLSVAVAFFLFATLWSVVTTFDAAVEVGSEARLVTSSATGITFVLPQAHANRIEAIDGVTSVSWANWFGGTYIDPQHFSRSSRWMPRRISPCIPRCTSPTTSSPPSRPSGTRRWWVGG